MLLLAFLAPPLSGLVAVGLGAALARPSVDTPFGLLGPAGTGQLEAASLRLWQGTLHDRLLNVGGAFSQGAAEWAARIIPEPMAEIPSDLLQSKVDWTDPRFAEVSMPPGYQPPTTQRVPLRPAQEPP